MGSSGLHSNGYSLVRHVLLQGARLPLDAVVDELGVPLGEELLVPTRIYAKDCLALIAETDVRVFSHVTGGGLAANLARVLPSHLSVTIDRVDLDAAAGVRRSCRRAAGSSRPRWSAPSTWASAWSPSSRPRTSTGRWRC